MFFSDALWNRDFDFTIRCATLRFWKVTVKGEKILLCNSFGGIKTYQFDDITCAVKKESGELRVYSGNKILFVFTADIDYLYFDIQLSEKGIPKKSWKEFKRMRKQRDKPHRLLMIS